MSNIPRCVSSKVSRPALSRHRAMLRRLITPLLWGLGVSVVLFAAYEQAESWWWRHADPRTLHALHLVRGVVACVVVAAVVGWMILRASPEFPPAPVQEDLGRISIPRDETERLKTYARWFIAMRWMSVLVAGLLVFVSVQLVAWLPQTVWGPLAGSVVVLALTNVAYTLLLRHNQAVHLVLVGQAYVDLVLLTALLHFSGGIENPLTMMMLFHVIIGGVLLSRRQCYWIAAAASVLFGLMAWGEWSDFLPHYTLLLYPHMREAGGELFHPAHHTLYVVSRVLLQAVVLFLSAYFVTTLAERLRDNERRLESMAEQALAGQQLLEQSLETTGAGLRVLTRQMDTYWANHRWKEWFECPPGKACPGYELLNGDAAPARHTLRDHQIRVSEVQLPHSDGGASRAAGFLAERVFQVTTAPLPDRTGEVGQIVELAQDITVQKRTQAQMMRAGKLAAVGELAGQVAHEVNNPIAIISAKTRLLLADQRADLSERVAQELTKITDLADRVARIAQGLLSYCRPAPGTRTRLDCRVPIRKSLALIEPRAKRSGIQVEDQLAAKLPFIEANAGELEQVFLNLFLNAMDAMPRGGRLRVRAEPKPTAPRSRVPAVVIAVEDTGPGIPPELRERIFEPFFTTKKEGRGTGLGLSICLGLIHSHGGELTVESEPGQGARFLIKLPVPVTAETEIPSHGSDPHFSR